MRRFIEEFKVKDPNIAYRIAAALETRDESNRRDPVYEVDVYPVEGFERDCQNERMVHSIEVSLIKIFIREDIR